MQKYVEGGSVLKKAQHFQNVVNEPLVAGDDDKLILEILAPPELHLLFIHSYRLLGKKEATQVICFSPTWILYNYFFRCCG